MSQPLPRHFWPCFRLASNYRKYMESNREEQEVLPPDIAFFTTEFAVLAHKIRGWDPLPTSSHGISVLSVDSFIRSIR